MFYSENAIAALHQARSVRLQGKADGGTGKSRGLSLRTLVTRGRKALSPAPAAQPVHSG